LAGAVTGNLEVLVTFSRSNESRLPAELSAISDPGSSSYQKYLSRSTFDAWFGAPVPTYRAAVTYFDSFGVSDLATYPDRGSISFVTTPSVADRVFGTSIAGFEAHGHRYVAPTTPIHLPRSIASAR
jgi:subtilase family serine protease